jgi:hypothetical protein
MPIYTPCNIATVDALQWSGNWEEMSLFCYGVIHEATETFYESGHPVVCDGNELSVLAGDRYGASGAIAKIGDFVQRSEPPAPHLTPTFRVWPEDEFRASFYVKLDGSAW